MDGRTPLVDDMLSLLCAESAAPLPPLGLASVGFVQAHSTAAVIAFKFMKTAVEKGGHRLRTAYHFDRESLPETSI